MLAGLQHHCGSAWVSDPMRQCKRTEKRLCSKLQRDIPRETHAHTSISKSLDGEEGIGWAAAAEAGDCIKLGFLEYEIEDNDDFQTVT